MANRHQRRKRAKQANLARTIELASIQRAVNVQKIVKANLSSPRERVYNYGTSCAEAVRRNVGPSTSASREIAAMLRGKAYTAK